MNGSLTNILFFLQSKMAGDFINGPRNSLSPFLMVLSPPAPHAPFTPASRHNDVYKKTKAKRTPNFNTPTQNVGNEYGYIYLINN